MRMSFVFVLVLLSTTFVFSACQPEEEPSESSFRTIEGPILVKDLPRLGGDYPDELMQGLAKQLIDEVNCIQPGVLARFEIKEEAGHIWTTRNIHFYLRPEAVAAAEGAALTQNDWMSITSGYRDVGMQYYDWVWGQKLGFLAARPGSSRHQAGQAIDVQFHDFWRPHLLSYGWEWPYGNSDRPHFEWLETNTPDLMVESVRAFQRLWNRNNPSEIIDEDGGWGPLTEGKMEKTDAGGFTYGGCDTDLDGYSASLIDGGTDCDDTNPNVSPAGTEVCGDGLDNDCVDGDEPCAGQDTSNGGQDTSSGQDTSTGGQDTSSGTDTNTPPQDTESGGTDTDTNTGNDTNTTPDTDNTNGGGFNALSNEPKEGARTAESCGCTILRTPHNNTPLGLGWVGLALMGLWIGIRRRKP